MKEKEIEHIYNELKRTFQNLKAEVYVSEILDKSSLDLTDIDVFNKSTFSRSYRRDVINAELDSYTSKNDKLRFNLARNGLYDALPEGLFHDSVKTRSNISYAEMHQKHKKQEKDARFFFTPLENEFFTQKVFVEENEKKLINEFANLKTDFLFKFWNLSRDIPKEYNMKLLQLLPYVHKISGNKELTALCLEKILNQKIHIYHGFEEIKEGINQDFSGRDLGVNTVLAIEESALAYPYWKFVIELDNKKNIDKFVTDLKTKKFIRIFCDYFVPLEIEIKFEILYPGTDNTFELNEINSPRMGVTTTI